VYFTKALEKEGVTYEEALAHVEQYGDELIKVVTDEKQGNHILFTQKNGTRSRLYFEGKATAEAATEEETETTKHTEAELAAYGHKLFADNLVTKEFEKRINEVKQRDKCSRTVAMRTARFEFPDEFEAYQNA
jgi:hypothetical protein